MDSLTFPEVDNGLEKVEHITGSRRQVRRRTLSRGLAEPLQEGWRELGAERQSVRFADKQCRVSASAAIDLHEIIQPEILDAGRIEGNHLRARVHCSF
jgi:hypothetical protein